MRDATVAILLATYQGQNYLAEQLNSYLAQSYPHWQLWVSDDGSTDDTREILRNYQRRARANFGEILDGPKKGLVVNFLSLVCNPDIQTDYYAFSDQDDIWLPDKLERAVRWLSQQDENQPALYCSRTELVDANNQSIGFSPLFSRQPSFANALVQSIAGGNTMMFNRAARQLLQEGGMDAPAMVHDWWTYQLVTGCGGVVYYDEQPTLRYRQHDDNLIGSNVGWGARVLRIRLLMQGSFCQWNDRNLMALATVRSHLTDDNQKVLTCFSRARQSGLLRRLVLLHRSGIYRQSTLGNLGLAAAALLNRI